MCMKTEEDIRQRGDGSTIIYARNYNKKQREVMMGDTSWRRSNYLWKIWLNISEK